MKKLYLIISTLGGGQYLDTKEAETPQKAVELFEQETQFVPEDIVEIYECKKIEVKVEKKHK